jgi:hypothetical protein
MLNRQGKKWEINLIFTTTYLFYWQLKIIFLRLTDLPSPAIYGNKTQYKHGSAAG